MLSRIIPKRKFHRQLLGVFLIMLGVIGLFFIVRVMLIIVGLLILFLDSKLGKKIYKLLKN